ncbi:MAG: hypothetical protein JSS07_07795 [Proteobacteria bacterium]|nr:hypothetical protein [Pseudomonadota bacterium]
MIFRFLLLLSILILPIVGIVVYGRYLLGRWLNSFEQKQPPKQITQKLVKCAYCGTFVPESQAYPTQDGYYCSQEHTKL